MCLQMALERPEDVLAHKKHKGFEFMVIHNRMGYRCGYVRVPKTHLWARKKKILDTIDVHGGVTFGEEDVPCAKGGSDDGFWVGFDCGHFDDAPDPKLMQSKYREWRAKHLLELYENHTATVKTQTYVEKECRSVCQQAWDAKERKE